MNEFHTSTCVSGENYLALDGIELEVKVVAPTREDPITTLWDDYFDEDIALLRCKRQAH